MITANPEVAEEKRFCAKCGAPVGRSRDGRPGRTQGFCPKCRTEFSYAPKLSAGDLVGGQYEVVGPLAHGGLGWIYLAADKNVSDRWVVLKGLLNAGDLDAYQAAVAERQFLAEVQHPLIVNIYNFAMYEDAGYTVMEYVGGSSLKQILKVRMDANHGRYDPFPADQAIAYMIEILPAFSYLHSQGLLYCDFKPDNIIQFGDAVKLIDLGGVRRIDDNESAIYGTVGYQAPEIATLGPSVASDIYTIGRTLAVLLLEFRGHQSTYVKSLPPVDDTDVFQRYDSPVPGAAPRPRPRTGTTASNPRTSCASSYLPCCARWWPATGRAGRRASRPRRCYSGADGIGGHPRMAGAAPPAGRTIRSVRGMVGQRVDRRSVATAGGA